MDAEGSIDFGNVDCLQRSDGRFHVAGCRGEDYAVCSLPELIQLKLTLSFQVLETSWEYDPLKH
jgi:hypothetical protein